jgi:hypothetical protein
MDLVHTDPKSPDKVYASATITYNFANAEGKAQQEFLGFILARDGKGWRIERNAPYTKEQSQAANYLAGRK